MKKQGLVFVVPAEETGSGKHEVIFASDGDLNKASVKGNIKRFPPGREGRRPND